MFLLPWPLETSWICAETAGACSTSIVSQLGGNPLRSLSYARRSNQLVIEAFNLQRLVLSLVMMKFFAYFFLGAARMGYHSPDSRSLCYWRGHSKTASIYLIKSRSMLPICLIASLSPPPVRPQCDNNSSPNNHHMTSPDVLLDFWFLIFHFPPWNDTLWVHPCGMSMHQR